MGDNIDNTTAKVVFGQINPNEAGKSYQDGTRVACNHFMVFLKKKYPSISMYLLNTIKYTSIRHKMTDFISCQQTYCHTCNLIILLKFLFLDANIA